MSDVVITPNRKTLILGAGAIGNHYVGALVQNGVDLRDVAIVDIHPERAQGLARLHNSGVAWGTTLPEEPCAEVYVTSNTSSHLHNLRQLLQQSTEAGTKPPSVLCEKPLCMVAQTVDHDAPPHENAREMEVRSLISAFTSGFTAYLINFSPAMQEALEFMVTKNLVVIEGSARWTKNRMMSDRPSAGDLEDEMTHPLAALKLLCQCGQRIERLEVASSLSYLRFVDQTSQSKMRAIDPLLPEHPVSSTQLSARVHTSRLDFPILLSMYSSFISPRHERRLEVLLSDGDQKARFGLELIFDDPSVHGDRLIIRCYERTEPTEKEYRLPNNMARQLCAFQEAVQTGSRDPRLHSLHDGLETVLIARAAYRSDEQASSGWISVPLEA